MKKINVREFTRNFYTVIKDAPFVVTSKGKDLIVVTLPGQNVVTSPLLAKNVVTNTPKVSTQSKDVMTNPVTYQKPPKGTSGDKTTIEKKKKYVNEYAEKREDWTF